MHSLFSAKTKYIAVHFIRLHALHRCVGNILCRWAREREREA